MQTTEPTSRPYCGPSTQGYQQTSGGEGDMKQRASHPSHLPYQEVRHALDAHAHLPVDIRTGTVNILHGHGPTLAVAQHHGGRFATVDMERIGEYGTAEAPLIPRKHSNTSLGHGREDVLVAVNMLANSMHKGDRGLGWCSRIRGLIDGCSQ